MKRFKNSLLALGMVVTCLCSGVSAMNTKKSDLWVYFYNKARHDKKSEDWAKAYADVAEKQIWEEAYASVITYG